mgnify:CR=1 FL=1
MVDLRALVLHLDDGPRTFDVTTWDVVAYRFDDGVSDLVFRPPPTDASPATLWLVASTIVDGELGEARKIDVVVHPHHRVDLARDQGRREREIDVDQLDVGQRQAVLLQHGPQQRFLEAADREADLAALEIGDRLDRAVRQHHQAVERRCHQRADAHQGQVLLDLQVQLRLVGDGDVGLPRRHQLGLGLVRVGDRIVVERVPS